MHISKQHKVRELDIAALTKSCTAVVHDMITRNLECP